MAHGFELRLRSGGGRFMTLKHHHLVGFSFRSNSNWTVQHGVLCDAQRQFKTGIMLYDWRTNDHDEETQQEIIII